MGGATRRRFVREQFVGKPGTLPYQVLPANRSCAILAALMRSNRLHHERARKQLDAMIKYLSPTAHKCSGATNPKGPAAFCNCK